MDDSEVKVVMAGCGQRHIGLADMLIQMMALQAMIPSRYMEPPVYIPKHPKNVRGEMIVCCKCGENRGALRKRGDDYICQQCFKEKGEPK